MKRILVAILGLAIVSSVNLAAQHKKLGVGVILGAPTGLTVKYWRSLGEAIQGHLGGGFGGLSLTADYLFHSNAFDNPDLPFYYGPGVFLGSSNIGGTKFAPHQTGVGVRMMFGANYVFPRHPFDLAIEIGPALLLSPLIGMTTEAGLAFRFYP